MLLQSSLEFLVFSYYSRKFYFFNSRYHYLLLAVISVRKTSILGVKKEESCFSHALSISVRHFKERHKRQSTLKELVSQPTHRSIICDVIPPPPPQIPSHIHVS